MMNGEMVSFRSRKQQICWHILRERVVKFLHLAERPIPYYRYFRPPLSL